MSNGNGQIASRVDLDLIAQMIAPGSRVLDVGCGDGDLLALLQSKKNVDGRGVELSQEGVNACVARGLSVVQGDADTDLANYPDGAFDYVILSQTIQATRNPKEVMRAMKRIGRCVVVSFPNFGHWRVRLKLLFTGRMPETRSLGYSWYDTPNIHLCTLLDFASLCEELGLKIEDAVTVTGDKARRISRPGAIANLLASEAVFLLSRRG
ncbi:methionine biosynthesis protein MetW [Parvibaculum sp.]|uniref:methionine biosynthesis protein MetW n=1 Tax=Parvibaculum sp. TaxID=2024848 RepID=UPI00273212EE|nr:methionine biosynthesis protein MetW [Parvibaculum sp.]MDP1625780.1 methionine biosynthesis protein MetW [Parvibaculum sp.]MDP2149143.1 methionine biosynthesis protein MetW [Parvibaculum sp.]MDP3329804.1 methionine biosynthesis protein MetW [Parvibaculum sp.]